MRYARSVSSCSLALVAGGALLYAGRTPAGPGDRDRQARRNTSARPRRRRDDHRAGRAAHALRRLRAERQADPALHAGRAGTARRSSRTGRIACAITARRSASSASPTSRPAPPASSSPRPAPGALRLRTLSSTASHDVQVRLEPPHVAVALDQALHQPRRLRDRRLPRDAGRRRVRRAGRRPRVPGLSGQRRQGRGVSITDPAVEVAFFALRYDQDVNTPMRRLRAR